jgi:hypothetical protein
MSNVLVPTDAGIVDIPRHGQRSPSAPQQGCPAAGSNRDRRKKRGRPGLRVLLQRRRRGGSVRSLPPSLKRLTSYYPRITIRISRNEILRICSMTRGRAEARLLLYVQKLLRNVQNGPPSRPHNRPAKRVFVHHRHCRCADGPPRKHQRPQPSAGEQPLL